MIDETPPYLNTRSRKRNSPAELGRGQRESQGATKRYGISSSVSAAICLADMPEFAIDSQSESSRLADSLNSYSLQAIVTAVDLEYKQVYDDIVADNHGQEPKVVSDHVAAKCIEVICNEVDADYEILKDKEIPGMRELSALQATSAQRPDGVSFNKITQRIGLVYDVQSSPMEHTQAKAVLGASNLIRLLRNEKLDFSEITVFALPSVKAKSCIVQIVVKWDTSLQFIYSLKCFNEVSDGVAKIKEVFTENTKWLPRLPRAVKRYYIPLTENEISKLLAGAEQLQSKSHIIVRNSKSIVKAIYQPNEITSFFHFSHSSGLSRVINPTHLCGMRPVIYRYTKVVNGPLTRGQAFLCMKQFIGTVITALQELHGRNLSHNDLRLPNICFNDCYEAVLIDMDRCWSIENLHPCYGVFHSVMYKMPTAKTWEHPIGKSSDYSQLGWMLAWILDKDSTLDEHKRTWDVHSESVRANRVISSLIFEGKYRPELVDSSFSEDVATIASFCTM